MVLVSHAANIRTAIRLITVDSLDNSDNQSTSGGYVNEWDIDVIICRVGVSVLHISDWTVMLENSSVHGPSRELS